MTANIDREWLKKLTEKLHKEQEEIKKQIISLKKDDPFSDPDYVNDNAAIDTDVREQGYHQVLEAEISALQKRSTDIDAALEKIEKGRYGMCSRCGKAIPEARLKLIPEAMYCVTCEGNLKK